MIYLLKLKVHGNYSTNMSSKDQGPILDVPLASCLRYCTNVFILWLLIECVSTREACEMRLASAFHQQVVIAYYVVISSFCGSDR